MGYLVEGGFQASTVAGGDIDEGAEREGDDVGALIDGVLNAGEHPAQEAGRFSGVAASGICGRGSCGRHALEDFDVEDVRIGGDSCD